MYGFSFIKTRDFFNNLYCDPVKNSLCKINSSNKQKRLFSSTVLKCNEEDLSEKTLEYINCLPSDFLRDNTAPPPFSYSWLQRLGRMDIFSERIENETMNEKKLFRENIPKSDPIFRIPRKKKKKKVTENFDLVIGRKKEEKMILFQSQKNQNDKNYDLVRKVIESKKDQIPIELKKPKIKILEISFLKFPNLLKFSFSIVLIALGFFLGHISKN